MTTTYQSPGVYIQEVPSGPQPIAGVSASVLAIVGSTSRGPVLDPQRVTGWGEFIDRFGGPMDGSHTAAAISGFFENGGQAAWIIRADPSTSSRWLIQNADGDSIFMVTAASPGAWSADMTLTVTPSTGGGLARPWSSTIVDVDTALNTVTVESAAGLRIDNEVGVGTPAARAVTAISGNVLTLAGTGPTLAFTPGAPIFIVDSGGGTAVDFATSNGIEVGDLIRIEVPGQPLRYTHVTAVDAQSSGGARMETTPAVTNVVGGATAARTVLFNGSLNAAGLTEVTAAQLDIPADALDGDDLEDGYQLVLSNGQVARWSSATNSFSLPGGGQLDTGDVQVQAPVRLSLFEQDVNLTNPTLLDLATLFSWVPDGAVLNMTPGDVEITKAGAAFTVVDQADLTATFTGVEFLPGADTSALITAPRPPAVGDTVNFGNTVVITDVTPIGGTRYQVGTDIAPSGTSRSGLATAFQQTRIVPERFALTVGDGGFVESFDNLTIAEGHSRSHLRDGLVNEVSTLITVSGGSTSGTLAADTVPVQAAVDSTGTSEVADANDLVGGIGELERLAEPAILICPDALTFDDPALQGSVIGALTTHAEQFRRFAVIDTPRESNDQDLVDWRFENVNSIYAAAYAPHVRILNLDGDAPERFLWVPPSGHIAGVFARTDTARGVHKAPANERVNGIVGLDQDYTQRRQDLLNPNGVNLIRSFPGRGRRIWGARNATTDTTWRYVNVRRLFNVIENSIEQGTQWTVFEPNTASTWVRIRASVENYLNGLWTAGALAGNSPDEAYRVRVGLGQTMTEAQIELGLVIIEVAVAAARPAEFVVFRFSHKRLSE